MPRAIQVRKPSMLAKMRAALKDVSSENTVAIGDPDQWLARTQDGTVRLYLKQC